MDSDNLAFVFTDVLPKVHAFRSLSSLHAHYRDRRDLWPLLGALHTLKCYYNRGSISEERWRRMAALSGIGDDGEEEAVSRLKDIVDEYVRVATPVACREWLSSSSSSSGHRGNIISMKSVALKYLLTTPDIQRGVVEDDPFWEDSDVRF